MILFFDTETTGLPDDWNAPITDFENWPRMVQVAYILCDYDEKVFKKGDYIIKPNGFVIPKEAAAIHGITTEKALDEGVEIETVLEELKSVIARADYLVAHNITYDKNILGAEFLRNGMQYLLEDKEVICTMESATNFCAIPGPYGFKWPTLSEMHLTLFETTFEEAHNASVDISITAKCFWELVGLSIIDINEHINKKRKHSTKISLLDLPELIPYRKGDKWGFCDREKNIKIECLYGEVSLFIDEKSMVKLDSKKGCIDKSGNMIIDFQFDEIYEFKNELARFKINEKFGFLNKSGTVIIEPKYEYARDFYEGFAIIRLDNIYGFVDSSGNLTLMRFDGINDIADFRSGFAKINMCCQGYLKDVSKRNIIDFNLPLSPPTDEEDNYMLGEGIIDAFGKIIIDPIYDTIYRLKNGYYEVTNNYAAGDEIDSQENYLQPNGLMVEVEYQANFVLDKKSGFLIDVLQAPNDDMYKKITRKSKTIAEEDFFPSTSDENENHPYGSREYRVTNKISILDKNLDIAMITICSDGKYSFDENDFLTDINSTNYEQTLWALADSNGKKITDFIYTEVNYSHVTDELVALRNLENLWGIVDLKNNVLIDFKYFGLKYNKDYKDLIEVSIHKEFIDFGKYTFYKCFINTDGMEYWED